MSDASQEITPLGNGRYLVTDGTTHRIAYAAAAGRQTWVFIDGRTFVVDASHATRTRGGSSEDAAAALSSPMPATVSRVQVEVGQTVRNGDVLVVLEAMKMELAIKAPRDGRVKSIACREGEMVQPGVALVELE